MIWKWNILLIFFLSFSSLHAQKLIILNNEEKNTIGLFTSVLEDPTKKLKINDVIKSRDKFAASKNEVFSSTKTTSAFWIKFQVKNLTDNNYSLIIDNPFINEIALYSEDQNKITLLAESGNLLPFSHRPIQSNNFIFPINLSKGETKTFYIRYYSTWRMEIPLSLQTSKKIIEHSVLRFLWYGFFYGVLIVSLFYIFFLYLTIKEKSFIIYLFLAISVGIFRALNHGLAFQFIFPNQPSFNNFLIYLGYSILGILLIRFTQEFLKTKEKAPVLHIWGNYTNAILIALFFVSFFSKPVWFYASNIIFIVEAPYLIIAGLIVYRQGYTPARFYLISAINYSINFVIAVIRNFGLLPYSFAAYNIADIFFTSMAIFFSLALGDRYNLLEKKRKKAQDNLNKELELKITERTKTNKKLKELNESLDQSLGLSTATLEATADGFLVVDKKGNISGYNQKFVDMWQIPDSILKLKADSKALEFVLDQLSNPKNFISKVREIYSKPEEDSFDLLEFKDGKIFERFSKPQMSGEKIIGRVWSFRDVTERKRAEDRNKKLSEKLEHQVNDLTEARDELKKVNLELRNTSTDLDNFIYTASHDLRIPISNIEGLINILSWDSLKKDEFEKTQKLLNTSVDKFKNTVGDLIEVAKVQRMREENDVVGNDIREIIEKIASDYKDQIDAYDVIIRTDIERYNSTIRFSRKNFLRILDNIISNAIKFRSPERKPEILIKTQSKGDFIILCIEDNGLGINEAYKQRVFELFKKAHDHIEGRGIGLYIIKRIIENAGGRIELESEEGKGSTFCIYFNKN